MTTTATSIREQIELDIARGVRVPGDKIASVRDLAAVLGVSPNTVAAAYKQLRDRGVVSGRGRQGTVVAPFQRPTLGQVDVVPNNVVDALRGSPDPELLPDLGPALRAAATDGHVHYGTSLLDPRFETEARSLFEDDGIEAQNLTATSGAMDAIEKILAANDLRPGDRVGVEDPGHVPVHQLVRAAGLIPVPILVDEEGISPESLGPALTQGLSALVVTPRAHNPTGAALTHDRAVELSELLAPHPDVVLIQDDHAGAICGAPLHLIEPPGSHYAHIRSLGKSLGPDLRVSITVGDPQTIDRVAIAVSNGPGWVSHLLQRASGFLLADPDAQKTVAHAQSVYAARRIQMVEALTSRGVFATAPSGLNVWVPVADEQAAIDAARAAGFAIRGADTYRLRSGAAVRITVAALTATQIDTLASALAEHLAAPRRAAAV